MLEYMLDTNICIYVIKNRPASLRDRFDQLAAVLCIQPLPSVSCSMAWRGRRVGARISASSNSLPRGSTSCHFRPTPQRISGRYEVN